ncbi:MAG: amino acid adenylation domain-containing protein [Acidobacteriota bacterium]|nr:amino acid adenylation domain-containing protein [Acidobacteriota bacterium]
MAKPTSAHSETPHPEAPHPEATDSGSGAAAEGKISPARAHALRWEWSRTFGGGSTGAALALHQRVLEQARRTPEAVAVEDAKGVLTYARLAQRSARWAQRLEALGAGPGDRVGVLLERSRDLVVALLAVLRTGAAYVPLDPAYPRERLGFMLQDSAVAGVLSRTALLPSGLLSGESGGRGFLFDLDAEEPPEEGSANGDPEQGAAVAPENGESFLGSELAYVIYTSGSTGRPKGVGVTHANAGARLDWSLQAFDDGEMAVMFAVTSVCFDLSVFEIFAPLVRGGRVVLAAGALALSGHPAEHRVTFINTVPSAMRELLRRGPLGDSVRVVGLAGEPLRRGLAEAVHGAAGPGGVRLLNLYGPSEDTTYSTAEEVVPQELDQGIEPAIGRPLPGTVARVFGSGVFGSRVFDGVSPGQPGELFLGGRGVTRGYLGRPALTAERYCPDPLAEEPGARLYRTGDLVCHRPDGRLDFRGRKDHQVKLRGFRIELGEVEAALVSHPEVAEAVVGVRTVAGEPMLTAWVAAPEERLADLRAFLAERLPQPMVPGAWMALERLPRTPNGKVDRAALPNPRRGQASSRRGKTSPRRGKIREAGAMALEGSAELEGAAETTVARAWCEVLGLDAVAPEDDFFELGGHSLLAPRLARQLSAELGRRVPPEAVFEHPTVRALAAWLEAAERFEDGPKPGHREAAGGGAGPWPVTSSQRQLWLFEQAHPDTAAYNVLDALDLEGALDLRALDLALAALVERHPALRTRIAAESEGEADGEPTGEPAQSVAPAPEHVLATLDLSRLSVAAAESEGEALSRREGARPLALDAPTALRATLLRLPGGDRHHLLLTFHHAAVDGTSEVLYHRDLGQLYGRALERATPMPTEPGLGLGLELGDWALWEQGRLPGKAAGIEARADRLAEIPALELPMDRPRPGVPTFRGGRFELQGWLGKEVTTRLVDLGRARGATPYMTFLALFQLFLGRLSGQRSFAVGTPTDLRVGGADQELAGYLVNMLVVPAWVPAAGSFGDLVDEVRAEVLEALRSKDLPYPQLAAAAGRHRGGGAAGIEAHPPGTHPVGANPLFQVLFQVVAPEPLPDLSGLTVRRRRRSNGTAKLDLELTLTLDGGDLGGYLEYAADLFDHASVARFLQRLERLARAVAAAPSASLAALPLLTPAEEEQVLGDFGRGPESVAGPQLAHAFFLDQARRTPAAPALRYRETEISYGELEERSAALAVALGSAGVEAEDRVGILLPRGPDQVVAVLAVLRAGATYVPLDPAYPEERLRGMAADAGLAAVVALPEEGSPEEVSPEKEQEGLLQSFTDAGTTVLFPSSGEAAPSPDQRRRLDAGLASLTVHPEALAYVIFTSGSTGRPKGVALSHGALANLVLWQNNLSTPESRGPTLQFAALSFDVSFQEMFATFAAGGTLVLVDEELRTDPARLLDHLRREAVERLFLPFVALQALALAGAHRPPLEALRHLITAGEQLRVGTVLRRWLESMPGCRLHNQYGPSESHVTTAWTQSGEASELPDLPPVGGPISGHRAYVADAWGAAAGIGVPGELLLGGAGLARGYLGRPGWTAERFVPDPFSGVSGARLYRTGDRARWREDGALDFLGRADDQVKIRGYRIEPGEVAAALEECPEVDSAVVMVREDTPGHRRLVGYWVPAEGAVDPSAKAQELDRALLRQLQGRLPEPMVPAALVALGAFPKTPSGKLDRRALPMPQTEAGEDLAGTEPTTPAEQLLLEIFREVFGAAAVTGTGDDFFALGGHSLLAVQLVARVRDRLGVELSVRDIFEAPTVRALAQRFETALRAGHGAQLPPVEPRREEGPAPLSWNQQGFYILQRLAPESPFYRLPYVHRFAGRLRRGALDRAFEAVLRRHEALRTTVVESSEAGSEARQQVHDEPLETLRWIDLRGLGSDAEPTAERLLRAAGRQPPDLAAGPLVRGLVVEFPGGGAGDDQGALFLDTHHLISDGWTLGLVRRDLRRAYSALCAGESSSVLPPPPTPSFGDFAVWQRRVEAEGLLDGALDYFRETLAGAPEALELPLDRPRPPAPSFEGGVVRRPLEATAAVEHLARRLGATPFMVYMGAFVALLVRLSGQRDLVVGLPVVNRRQRELEEIAGCFVNTVAARLDFAAARRDVDEDSTGAAIGGLTGSLTGGDVVARVRDATLGAYAHQDLPFGRLVEELVERRDQSRNPLYQVSFQLLDDPMPSLVLEGLAVKPWKLYNQTSRLDLELFVRREQGIPTAVLEYSSDLFDAVTARRWVELFVRMLHALAEHPELPLAALDVHSPAQRQQLLSEWNDTVRDFSAVGSAVDEAPADPCLHQLVALQAQRTPEATALRFEGETLTYGELLRRAHHLAAYLAERGVGPETPVAVCMDRSLELPVALLAVLAAGAFYVPVDPRLPPERLRFMLQDSLLNASDGGSSSAAWVLTQERWLSSLEELTQPEASAPPGAAGLCILAVDGGLPEGAAAVDESSVEAGPDAGRLLDARHGAYAIYTSGSTGKPKGVLNSHRGIVNRLRWMQAAYELGPGDRVLQKTPFTFDVSVWELFWPLITGAEMVLARPEGHKDAAYLLELMADAGVTVVHFVPSMLQLFLEQPVERVQRLRQVVCSGEALPLELAQRFLEASPAALDNLYGPTEAAVDVTRWRCRRGEQRLPIGRPIANLGLRVVDREGALALPAAPGELLLAGVGLARGYLGRPALTAERFVPDPWGKEPGARAYRTGDLVRHDTDGAVEYLGRIDFQVKIRGFRIELGEIESALTAHPAVREAVVLARSVGDGGDLRLVAYLVVREETAPASLRAYLEAQLPEYMVPAHYVFLDALPLSANGKLDRRGLPDPVPGRGDLGHERVAPRTPTEERLAALWCQLLGVEEVGVHDDFFALGGHSLLAIHVMTHVRNGWELDLPVATLFRAPTIAELGRLLDGEGGRSTSVLVAMGGQSLPARPFYCVHGIGGNVFRLVRLARLMAGQRPFYGLQGWVGGGDTAYLGSVETMARRYVPEILALQPRGPYLLGGYSLGSLVAYEMARILTAEGHEVAFVGLLDVAAPSPGASPEAAKAELSKGSFEGGIARELGIPIEPDKLFALEPRQRLGYVLEAGMKSGALPPGFTHQDAFRYIDVYQKTGFASASYGRHPYGGRVALFSTPTDEEPPDPTLGWGELAAGGVDVYSIPGDHFSLVMEPHVEEVARTLCRALDEAERRWAEE